MLVLLASQSPRRLDLLKQVGFDVRVRPAVVDERSNTARPEALAREIAERKAQAACERGGSVDCTFGLAADTVVWTEDGLVLGKPFDAAEAAEMLRILSGRWHSVTTGFALFDDQLRHAAHATTAVRFAELSDIVIDSYIASAEPYDKAGAYGIQGRAAAFIPEIRGSYSNVVGLPLAEVCAAANTLGYIDHSPWSAA